MTRELQNKAAMCGYNIGFGEALRKESWRTNGGKVSQQFVGQVVAGTALKAQKAGTRANHIDHHFKRHGT